MVFFFFLLLSSSTHVRIYTYIVCMLCYVKPELREQIKMECIFKTSYYFFFVSFFFLLFISFFNNNVTMYSVKYPWTSTYRCLLSTLQIVKRRKRSAILFLPLSKEYKTVVKNLNSLYIPLIRAYTNRTYIVSFFIFCVRVM